MNVFIARDGEVIGEYPHYELDAMARRGELLPDDYYWHDGMDETWLPLKRFLRSKSRNRETPEPAPAGPPLDRRILYGGIAAAVILAALLGFLLIKPNWMAPTRTSASANSSLTELELRDKAAADLRARIERLPATAKPPLNTFYYDVRVSMQKHFSPRIPWSATIRGSGNLIDPADQRTLTRTDFVLTTDYEDGEWVHKDYRETVTTFSDNGAQTTSELEYTAAPPSLVGMMGLKLRAAPVTSQVPSLTLLPASSSPGSSPAILAPPILTRPPGK